MVYEDNRRHYRDSQGQLGDHLGEVCKFAHAAQLGNDLIDHVVAARVAAQRQKSGPYLAQDGAVLDKLAGRTVLCLADGINDRKHNIETVGTVCEAGQHKDDERQPHHDFCIAGPGLYDIVAQFF